MPFFALALTIKFVALFITLINFFSSLSSSNQANFSCEKKLKLFFPDFATTLDGLYKCPLVILTSSVIFSPGLKVTNILESSLLKLSGPLLEGTDWAKHILPLSVFVVKLCQFLYYPTDFGVSAIASKDITKNNVIKNNLNFIMNIYTKKKSISMVAKHFMVLG